MTGRSTEHGTTTAYTGHGCRCDLCRVANSEYKAALAARRRAERIPVTMDGRVVLIAPHAERHGTRSTYINYGCRCPECCEADARHQASRRFRRR